MKQGSLSVDKAVKLVKKEIKCKNKMFSEAPSSSPLGESASVLRGPPELGGRGNI